MLQASLERAHEWSMLKLFFSENCVPTCEGGKFLFRKPGNRSPTGNEWVEISPVNYIFAPNLWILARQWGCVGEGWKARIDARYLAFPRRDITHAITFDVPFRPFWKSRSAFKSVGKTTALKFDDQTNFRNLVSGFEVKRKTQQINSK